MSLPDADFFVRTRITDFIRAVKWNVRFRNEHQELLLPIVNWVSGVLERLTHPGRFHGGDQKCLLTPQQGACSGVSWFTLPAIIPISEENLHSK